MDQGAVWCDTKTVKGNFMSKKLFELCVIMLIGCVSLIYAVAKDSTACEVKEIYNEDGWDLPGSPIADILKLCPSEDIKNQWEQTYFRINPPLRETYVVFFSGSKESSDRFIYECRPVHMDFINVYVKHYHVFAISFFAVTMGIEDNGKRVMLGEGTEVFFYDIDGSGRFKLLRYSEGIQTQLIVPDWVNRDQSKDKEKTKK